MHAKFHGVSLQCRYFDWIVFDVNGIWIHEFGLLSTRCSIKSNTSSCQQNLSNMDIIHYKETPSSEPFAGNMLPSTTHEMMCARPLSCIQWKSSSVILVPGTHSISRVPQADSWIFIWIQHRFALVRLAVTQLDSVRRQFFFWPLSPCLFTKIIADLLGITL